MECLLCHNTPVTGRYTKMITTSDVICKACEKFIEQNKGMPSCSR